jgi:hypothetical protein
MNTLCGFHIIQTCFSFTITSVGLCVVYSQSCRGGLSGIARDPKCGSLHIIFQTSTFDAIELFVT